MKQTNVHLDFHTSEAITGIGADFSTTDFIAKLQQAALESITCFAKCHHGYLYYDTALPERHPHLQQNLLRLQYEATKQANIEMPVYISVGFDELQAGLHPEWIALSEEGRYIKEFGNIPFDSGWHWLCLNNSYTDKIIEVIDDVIANIGEVTGFFFDIITQPACCCMNCRKKMLAQNMQPHLAEQRQIFAKEVEASFKNLVFQHIKSKLPQASVFFNGLVWNTITDDGAYQNYTQLEIESLPSGIWGYEHYPLVVKALQHQALPTMAMSARFHKSWADFGGYKNLEALEYETMRGAILSGSVSIGDQLHPRGAMDDLTYQNIAKTFTTAKPVMELFATLTPYHEIALIVDNTSEQAHLFSKAVSGASRILQSEQQLFTILEKQYFSLEKLVNYALLLFPDYITLTNQEEAILEAYIAQGGKILFTYMSGIIENKTFSRVLPIQNYNLNPYQQDYIEQDETKFIAYKSGILVEPIVAAKLEKPIWFPYFDRDYRHFSSHFQTPYEKNSGYFAKISTEQVSYFAHPLFTLYQENGNQIYKDLLMESVQNLLTPKFVVHKQSPFLQFEVAQKDVNTYYLAMLYYPQNRIGEHTVINSIEALQDIVIEVDAGINIAAVSQVFSRGKGEFDFSEKQINLDMVAGYEILEVTLVETNSC